MIHLRKSTICGSLLWKPRANSEINKLENRKTQEVCNRNEYFPKMMRSSLACELIDSDAAVMNARNSRVHQRGTLM